MTPERITELRALVAGLRNAAEMSHSNDQDAAADSLTETLDAIERVRALQKTHLRRELGGQWHALDDPPRLHGTEYICFLDVLAALEGKSP